MKTFVAIFAFFYASFLCAEELQENFYTIRPLGMGGAFVAIANDEEAIWSNPAGVARGRKARSRKTFFLTKFPNLGLGANARARKAYQSGSSDSLAETISESGDLGENKPYWTNLQAFPVMLFNYSMNLPGALGAFYNLTNKMLVSEDNPEQTEVNMLTDMGAITNLTWTNRTNRMSFGMNVRYIIRSSLEDTIPTSEMNDQSALKDRLKENQNKTTAIAIDAGGLLTFADFWFPTFGFSILNAPLGCQTDYLNPHAKIRQNVCGTKYTGTVANEDALSLIDPTDFRVGLSITPRITQKLAIRLALDAHHVYLPSAGLGLPGVEFQKMLHAGAELFVGNPLLRNPLSFRAGVGQGFLSTGFSFTLGFWSVDFATYGVDVSSTAKPVEDRRYILGTSVVW